MADDSAKMSPQLTMSALDWKKWVVDALYFILPIAAIYLAYVQINMQDGAAWRDFIPNNVTITAMVVYIINTLQNLLRKFMQGPKS